MRYLNNRYLWTIQGILIFMLILSAQVFAGMSWLDKGSEFLKSFGAGDKTSELSIDEIGAGLKEALKVGSQNVVNQLGTTDGFNMDSNIHIPLPATLDKVKSMLDKIGMSYLFETLELKLNRAAETATPKAKRLFTNAISQMTFQDVKSDLTHYVIEKGMDGIFYYMAKEETAIRQNPVKRTTELLRKVFNK